MFRIFGPQRAATGKRWILNDIEPAE